MKKTIALGLLLCVVANSSGCKKDKVVTFEPNMVFAHAMEMESGYSMEGAARETEVAVTQYFGTPDEPKIPSLDGDEYANLVSLDKLAKAAGDPVQAGTGLYRQHCATCHGIVGNGRGETAALLDPYPRDYRLGKFKFKSTERGAKPVRDDLAYSIKYGIAGTSMKVIPELTDEDIDALVDYVIYLAWRGEFERNMLMEGSELDFEGGEDGSEAEHLFVPGSTEFAEQEETAKGYLVDIADSWLEAEDRLKEVPEPEDIVVPATTEEVLAALASDEPSPVKDSVARGRELFASQEGQCTKCHGPSGYGDGPQIDYDDWTKEWTQRINIDPTNEEDQVPLIARGALPARPIKPRDFREGMFRGGGTPEKLYLRISAGIDGTPMPAAAVPPNEIWHLVNFIRSLAPPASEVPPVDAATKTEEKTASL